MGRLVKIFVIGVLATPGFSSAKPSDAVDGFVCRVENLGNQVEGQVIINQGISSGVSTPLGHSTLKVKSHDGLAETVELRVVSFFERTDFMFVANHQKINSAGEIERRSQVLHRDNAVNESFDFKTNYLGLEIECMAPGLAFRR